MVKQWAAGFLGMLLSAATALAQATLTVTDGVLDVGQSIEIEYSNPARAGGSVVVTMDNGEIPLATLEVVIQLDARGKGKVEWIVPDWWWVSFNADGAREVSRTIN